MPWKAQLLVWFFTHPRRWFKLVILQIPAGLVFAEESYDDSIRKDN
jgi:hypothetical protein